MKELMKKRQETFRTQCVKYSRYVLNDHFVLFKLIFIGFLAVQYHPVYHGVFLAPTAAQGSTVGLHKRAPSAK